MMLRQTPRPRKSMPRKRVPRPKHRWRRLLWSQLKTGTLSHRLLVLPDLGFLADLGGRPSLAPLPQPSPLPGHLKAHSTATSWVMTLESQHRACSLPVACEAVLDLGRYTFGTSGLRGAVGGIPRVPSYRAELRGPIPCAPYAIIRMQDRARGHSGTGCGARLSADCLKM